MSRLDSAGASDAARSCVPAVRGTLLRSTSPIALALMAAVGLGASSERAEALNDCGAPVAGAVICMLNSYPAPNGIVYTNMPGLTLTLDNPNLVAQRTGGGNGGVFVSGSAGNTNDIVINALRFQSVTSAVPLTNGIGAVNQGAGGNAIVRMDMGTVTVNTNSGGNVLQASITNAANAGNALVTLNGGQVINSGDGTITGIGNGVSAQNAGTGNAGITMTGGSVSGTNPAILSTSLLPNAVLRALISNAASSGSASVSISGGTVTAGSGRTVLSQSERGSAGITMAGGTVEVQSGTSPALSAVVNNAAGTGTASIAMSGGTVTNNGGGDGLFARNLGTGTYSISLTGGTVTGGSGTGAAIHGDAAAGGTIAIGADAVVNAGASGAALSQTGGAATITTAGAVTGNVNLSAAGNVLNVTGGAINGNINGGGSSALNFDLGSGNFAYGAPYTISGMANVAMASGAARIDGSFDTNTFAVNGGTFQLGGSGNATSGTSVTGGVLGVNGTLTGTVMVSGGQLQGTGTVGPTTIAAGGTIAPGNSIGTLNVNGAYVQNAGSIYRVEVDPGTVTSDRIQVSGPATLASGAALNVVNYTGAAYVPGQRYTILTSTGGLTGTYGYGTQPLTAFLSLSDSYDTNNAYLTVTQTATPSGVGSTPNEIEVGKGVESLPTGNSVLDGLLNQANLANARGALNQLSGEIHASARTALIDESWIIRNAANDRLRAAFGGAGAPSMAMMNYGYTADLAPAVKGPMPTLATDRFAVWGQGYGSWGRTSGDGNASTLSRSTGGFLVGADAAALNNLRFGVLAGYSRSNFDVKARASSGESDNYHLGLYGGGQWGALSLRTGASYTWHDVSTSRLVTAAYLGGNPRADYEAATAQVFGEIGYRMVVSRIDLEPFAGLAYVNLHTGRFAEMGAVTALSASGDDTNIGYSTLGLRASTRLAFGGTDLTLRGGLAWRHAFGDAKPSATMAFAGSTPFTISGLPIARDAAVIEAGADMAIGRNATLGLAYNGQIAQDAQDHSFKGVLAVRF